MRPKLLAGSAFAFRLLGGPLFHPVRHQILKPSDKATVATEEGFTLLRKPYSQEALERILATFVDKTRKIRRS
jgi:hypothetical protein